MTVQVTRTEQAGRSYRLFWEGLNEGNEDGKAISIPGAADRSVQLSGDFGGGTVVIQGSNEPTPTNWATLHDSAGDALSFTAAGLEVIVENTLWIRPLASSGSSQNVDVTILAKSTMR